MRRLGILLGAAALAAGAITSCSSSPPAGGSGSDTNSAASFEAAVAAYTKQPATIGDAPALTSAPPAGKKFVQISLGTGYDQTLAAGFKAATAEIGWSYSVLQANPIDPSTTLSALTTAINSGADVVVVAATPIAVWRSAIPAARASGTLIVSVAGAEDLDAEPAPDGVLYVRNGPADGQVFGSILVDVALADAGPDAKDIQMVTTEVPQLGALATATTAAERTRLAEKCPSCTLEVVQVPFADVLSGKGAQDIVAYLQRRPKTEYVIVNPGQSASGLSQAIRAASLPPVKILGNSPGADGLKDLSAGDNLAWLVAPFQLQGWQIVDVAIRSFENLPFYTWPPSLWLVTQKNVHDIADFADPEFPSDMADQFLRLWKVNG
ncbi:MULTISPECIES: substrate-binding domain-containing protein [unclassified Pseudofrankia]|uniref:sugar ABC transporter substrate-binding protein n=1 Tax=unclassified Pseudofrankia TaxID=2994372 RepID=UPI0008DAE897|nr:MULTISPECIES: substrate-binding domain-containing protein [unclassified Pseudofrankia]MDT3446641.1 substrate-binding domain-containing protein [Pseudofrankia sp. BMG5.37]OHV58633.1 hypothetical protein BCD48_42445 [Pseudofrankia sp. BMG5.36]